MKKMFGITELTAKYANRVPGFNVRLGWCDGRPSINAEFSCNAFGSRDNALKAAIKYRDKHLQKLKLEGKWPVDRVLKKPPKNNKSGVIGVSRARQWSRGRPSKDIYCWQATWICPKKKKPVTVKFSENKWGVDIAFDMACACREAKSNIFAGA